MPELNLLYERYYMELVRLGKRNGIPQSEVNDIINQTFLDLIEKKIDFSKISNPLAYIKVSFKRKVIDNYRYQRKTAWAKINITKTENNLEYIPYERIEAEESSTELVAQLYKSFNKLPKRCRRIIYLKYFSGLSNNEIAITTKLSPQSVYNNLSEGIKLLRAGLGEYKKNGASVSDLLSLALLIMYKFNN